MNDFDVIFSYTLEDGLNDGVFIEVTEKVKDILKWRSVFTDTLKAKIDTYFNNDQEKIDEIIKDIVYMFAFYTKLSRIDKYNKSFPYSFSFDEEPLIIFAEINISVENKPVLTFCLRQDL